MNTGRARLRARACMRLRIGCGAAALASPPEHTGNLPAGEANS
jgi:hypothetical protein